MAERAWVDDDERLGAACFTAVTGVEVDEVVRRFGGSLATERTATFEEAFNPYPDAQYLLTGARGAVDPRAPRAGVARRAAPLRRRSTAAGVGLEHGSHRRADTLKP